MSARPRVLVLGGSAEAAALARRLADRHDLAVVTSLAGRTRVPAGLPGEVRVGGFGGPEGLAAYLRESAVAAVVDATHPFAARMSENAAAACAAAGVPRLLLLRPPWAQAPGDRWHRVADAAAAAEALAPLARRAFLTVGRRDLAPFAALTDTWFLVRLIEAPAEPLPLPRHELLLARGPFAQEAEAALLREHAVEAVVSKNSGGEATYGKIAAARALGLPVVMIERPALPAGATAATVDEALAWLEAVLA